ncbi:Ig-like domain repeat protein [Pseudomonas sp. MG-9]|uniref:Ig-like domain-containing protein n=1 Tax=Pseudomonas sp. MG-9 TaxID=2839032 RepID=UPI001C001178|nr:Ig-like domain repeat protein [Pseudomonas sp. MG-9]MBT9266332.1 Ig-like domain repeat protein [Pseudomonas sp. MG-9]
MVDRRFLGSTALITHRPDDHLSKTLAYLSDLTVGSVRHIVLNQTTHPSPSRILFDEVFVMTHFRSFLFPVCPFPVAPLALRPIGISGMTQPVVNADGGINLKTYNQSPSGLLCYISAYAPPMLAGDKLEIRLGTEILTTRVLQSEEEDSNLPVFFRLLSNLLEEGLVEDLHYTLTRNGNTDPDDISVPLRLLVKLDLPGGHDKCPHRPGHSELHIVQLPQDVIDNGVDAAWAARGVPMTIPRYLNIAVRDVIQVKWGRAYLTPHVVTADEAAGTTPIVITAVQEDILAGGDGNAVPVHYEIHDEVWNYSVDWSQSTNVKVEAGGERLDAPIFKDSVNGIITLADLNNEDVTVQILVASADFALGDTLTMTCTGTPLTGKPWIDTQSKDITNFPSVVEFKIKYALFRAIAMGKADVAYVLYKKNGLPPSSSKRTFASVVGQVALIPAPDIRELLGDTLEPDIPFATVDIEYPGMANGDVVQVAWIGTRANGNPYVYEDEYIVSEGDAQRGVITVYVPGEHVLPLENGTLDLFYRVANDNPQLYGVSESEHLRVAVGTVQATLPIPKVVEADPPDVLDPSKIFDTATVLIEYLGTLKGDILTFYWTGFNSAASTSDWVPITELSVGKPVRFRVPARFVTLNAGQYVKVRYSLKHAATGRYSHSATLNLLVGELVGHLPPPDVIQAPDNNLDPMNALSGVDIGFGFKNMKSALDRIGLQWLGSAGAGTSTDLELPGSDTGRVQFHLPPPFVGPNIGRMVTVSCEVSRYHTTTNSETRDINVLRFQNPETQLPRPQVPQASGGVLDLMMITGDARVRVATWPFIALKQRAWLRMEGTTATGAIYRIELLNAMEISPAHQANGLDELLPRSELMKLGHSTPATVVCCVTFDGDSQESRAIEFPLLRLTVRTRYDYVTPDIIRIQDSRGEVIEDGVTRDTKVTISGSATRGETIELFNALSQSMGTTTVRDDSTWSLEIGILTEKKYSITAKALYDADPVSSQPRTFTVKFSITPQIRSVTDSRGLVNPGANTFDNSVLIEGEATPNEQVRLMDSTSSVATVNTNDRGEWRHRHDNLGVKSYNMIARALYDVQPADSPPYPFNVIQAVTPSISYVTDAKGNLDNGGTTYGRRVTVGGRASKSERIELRDGSSTLVAAINVGADENWSHVLENLTLKTYSLTAKALYGAQPISAPPRTFTVAAHVTPTITAATNSSGTIPDGGTSYGNAVTLIGTASQREQVQVYNGSTTIGSPVTVGGDNQWRLNLTGLVLGIYRMTAHALYDVTPISSSQRTFTVASHIAPTITSVKGANVEIPNSGSTTSTTVSLSGDVTSGHQVQIIDNNDAKHTVTASGTSWSTTLAVPVGGHSITAKAVTTGQVSAARSFSVVAPIPPLYFNTSPVTLSGKIYLVPASPHVLPAFGPGTSVQHVASGGQPGYTYSSSNAGVAVVDGAGLVTVRGRGTAAITVRDTANQMASYSVTVTGVIHCVYLGTGTNTWTGVNQLASAAGARIPSLAELRELHAAYGGRWPMGSHHFWSTDNSNAYWPFSAKYALTITSGALSSTRTTGGSHANGVGLR